MDAAYVDGRIAVDAEPKYRGGTMVSFDIDVDLPHARSSFAERGAAHRSISTTTP